MQMSSISDIYSKTFLIKILFINNGIIEDEPGVSGGETRFIEIAKNWALSGHEIHILSSYGGKQLCERLGLTVQLHSIPKTKFEGRLGHMIRLFQSIFQLPRSLFEEGFDVVYSTSELSYDVIP